MLRRLRIEELSESTLSGPNGVADRLGPFLRSGIQEVVRELGRPGVQVCPCHGLDCPSDGAV